MDLCSRNFTLNQIQSTVISTSLNNSPVSSSIRWDEKCMQQESYAPGMQG